MNTFIAEITAEIKQAFAAAAYRPDLGRVTVSNRPDLGDFQCNGAMAGAKEYKKSPLAIAAEVAAQLADSAIFDTVTVAAPGFLNLSVKPSFVRDYLLRMCAEPRLGVATPEKPLTHIVDYGGANVAKPLHIGHLRSAIIGESIKRIIRYAGHEAIADIHMGDWGLHMGLIIVELAERKPDLPYFAAEATGSYPDEAPFSLAELEEIYPCASERSKRDDEYRQRAQKATSDLQNGHPGYRAIWRHIMRLSVADLKKTYASLNVDFDLWKGEADVHDLIAAMVADFERDGHAYLSEGALVIDVAEEGDAKEIPPGLIRKSDGASLYLTTDLATIKDRMAHIAPDTIVYLTDQRQAMHFIQLFRCARKTGLVGSETTLRHLGFGTMNGADGKPFKTRDGGVMRLEQLVAAINEEMYKKIVAARTVTEDEAHETARVVGLAALKYGDLSNQAAKDYIFDIDRFTSFEGDTGPYILYTIVRIKSILAKYAATGGTVTRGQLRGLDGHDGAAPDTAALKKLMIALAAFNAMIAAAYEEIAPHRVAAYSYELANALNTFYHETKILTESVNEKRAAYLALIDLTREILETCIDLLGFSAPTRM